MAHVPDPMRQKLTTLGKEGMRWLDDLYGLIEAIEHEWQISVESSLAGGSEAYVANARMRDETSVILKLAIPEH